MIKIYITLILICITTYLIKDNITVYVLNEIFYLYINVSAILITMIGLWLAVVYNDFIKLISQAKLVNQSNDYKNAKQFIISIFNLSIVLVISILSLIIFKIQPIWYDIIIIKYIFIFFLLCSILLILSSLYRILAPFAKLIWKLEQKEKKN